MKRVLTVGWVALAVLVPLTLLGPVRATAADAVPSSWKMVSARGVTTCAISSTDALYCWGVNDFGQVGDGTTINALSPVRIGSASWRSVTTSQDTTCGIRTDRTAYCWGRNTEGQTGTGLSGDNVLEPTKVDRNAAWAEISPGYTSSCGTSLTGALYCWGDNSFGSVGDGTTDDRLSPVRVGGDVTWSVAHVGYYHACGRTTSSKVLCWGYGGFGALGNGSTEDVDVPTAVPGRFARFSTTAISTCAVTEDGVSQCWGQNNLGQLGDGTETQRNSPTTLTVGSRSFTTVLAGNNFSCGVTVSQAKVRCFGDNSFYEFGDGTTTSSPTPTDAAGGLTDWAKVSVGDVNACGIRRSGALYCWGDNTGGQLGVGTTDAYNHRVLVGRTPHNPMVAGRAARSARSLPRPVHPGGRH